MSFKALSKSVNASLQSQSSQTVQPLSERIKSLSLLWRKFPPSAGLAPALTVCIVVDDVLKLPDIWSAYLEDARQQKIDVCVLVVSMEAAAMSRFVVFYLFLIFSLLIDTFELT